MSYVRQSMLEEQEIQTFYFEYTMFDGFAKGRKLRVLYELNHDNVTLHHDYSIHVPLVASSPAVLIVQSLTDPERHPLLAKIYENLSNIENGWLPLNEDPRVGLYFSEVAVVKIRNKIY